MDIDFRSQIEFRSHGRARCTRCRRCDKTEADCKKCCMGEAAYRGKCSADQGEEACSQSCEMAHSECETAARQSRRCLHRRPISL